VGTSDLPSERVVLAWVAVVVQEAVGVGRFHHLHQDWGQLALQVKMGRGCDFSVGDVMVQLGDMMAQGGDVMAQGGDVGLN
jgi:hypothetical protein